MYIDADDQLIVRADSQFIVSSSRTGIGAFDVNITPPSVLHVSGTAATDTTFKVEGSDGTDYLTVGVGGHITASGNISSSGTITAQSASFSRINFGGNDGDMVFSGSAQQTGSIGHLILSDNSLQIGGANGTRFSKSDLDNLKEGKPVTLDSTVGGFSSIIRPQAIMSTLNIS